MMINTKMRMLFVEPDDAQQKVYSTVLRPEENDWELVFASNALDALDLCNAQPFDIVLSENRLPDQSGIGLLEILRETAPATIRFLLIDPAEAASLRTLVNPAQQVLVKPLKLKSFAGQVNRALALRTLVQDPAILTLIGESGKLPALPRIFQELTRMLNDAQASLMDVGELIAQDMALSSKILKLANSALFNLREPVQSVMQAVPLLGSSAVNSLVFSESMQSTFSGGGNEAFFEELNHHSIQVAMATSRILAHWEAGKEMIEKSIFCGIAHDIGKLVLAQYAPDKWQQVQAELKDGLRTDRELERKIIGPTHTDLAAYILTVWGFSNEQIIAIAFHHEPSRINEKEFGLLCALHIAEIHCSSEHGQEDFDWNYLEENRITPDDIEGIRTMLAEEGL